MKCFPPFPSYTEVLEGPGNHSRGAILSYFHPILAGNKSWTILNDHYKIILYLQYFQMYFRSFLLPMRCFSASQIYTEEDVKRCAQLHKAISAPEGHINSKSFTFWVIVFKIYTQQENTKNVDFGPNFQLIKAFRNHYLVIYLLCIV